MFKSPRSLFLAAGLLAAGCPLTAQQFQSPGRSQFFNRFPNLEFTNQFNPAFGVVLDGFFDYRIRDADDAADFGLRIMELNVAGAIDPDTWGYVALVSENAEAPEIEEAAVVFDKIPGNFEIKAGRFFVDFGKLMQMHLEELRTFDRPLPLREFLGEELGGVGVQFDRWFPVSDTTPMRFSVGIFSSLVSESHEEEGGDEGPEAEAVGVKGLDDLSLSARLTSMTDIGDNGLLQGGVSMRHLPNFGFSQAGIEATELSSTTLGLDVTYQYTSNSGQSQLLLGGEYLQIDGDLAGALDDPMTPTTMNVNNDTASGFYVFADYQWDQWNSAGIQFAQTEELADTSEDASELDFYYSYMPNELRRFRVGLTVVDAEEDEERLYVQITNFVGAHSHATKW